MAQTDTSFVRNRLITKTLIAITAIATMAFARPGFGAGSDGETLTANQVNQINTLLTNSGANSLLQNPWVALLIPFGNGAIPDETDMTKAYNQLKKSSPFAVTPGKDTYTLNFLSKCAQLGPQDLWLGTGSRKPQTCAQYPTNYKVGTIERAFFFCQHSPSGCLNLAQTYYNLIVKVKSIAPSLGSALNSGNYTSALQVADSQGIMPLLAEPILWMLLSVPALTNTQMESFYLAFQPYWGEALDQSKPIYLSKDYLGGYSVCWKGPGNLGGAAYNNASNGNDNKYPDVVPFMIRGCHESVGHQIVDFLPAIVLAVVTAGVASEISGALIAAEGATAGGVEATATTIATDAVVSSSITTAVDGGSFGQNLLCSLEGAAVGTELAPATGAMSSAMTSSGVNATASNFIASLATGTISNEILNGGNFSSAFEGAAVGAGVNTAMSRMPASTNSSNSNASGGNANSFDPNSTQVTGSYDPSAARTAYVNGTSMNGSSVANNFQPANLQPLTIAQLNQSVGAVDLSNIPMPVVNVATNENPASGALISDSNGSYSGIGSSGSYFNNVGSVAQANNAFANEVNDAVGIPNSQDVYGGTTSTGAPPEVSTTRIGNTTLINASPTESLANAANNTFGIANSGDNITVLAGHSETGEIVQIPGVGELNGQQLADYMAGLGIQPGSTVQLAICNAGSSCGLASDFQAAWGGNVYAADSYVLPSTLSGNMNGFGVWKGGHWINFGSETPSGTASAFSNISAAPDGVYGTFAGAEPTGSFAGGVDALGNFADAALPAAADSANLVGLGFSVVNATHTEAANYLDNTWQNGGLQWWNPNADVQYGFSAGINSLYNNVVNPAQTWVDNQVTGSSFYQNDIAANVNIDPTVEATQQMIYDTYGVPTTNPNSASVIEANLKGNVVAPDAGGTWLTIPEANSQGYIAPQMPNVTVTAPAPQSTLGSLTNTISSVASQVYNSLSSSISHGSTSVASTTPVAPASHSIVSPPRTSPVSPSQVVTPPRVVMPTTSGAHWVRGSGIRGSGLK